MGVTVMNLLWSQLVLVLYIFSQDPGTIEEFRYSSYWYVKHICMYYEPSLFLLITLCYVRSILFVVVLTPTWSSEIEIDTKSLKESGNQTVNKVLMNDLRMRQDGDLLRNLFCLSETKVRRMSTLPLPQYTH